MKDSIKKGKVTMAIAVSISCFVLMFVMLMQFKIVNQTDITAIENMRETELKTELANWKAKYEEANTKYNETKSKIEEYKKTKQSNEETEELVNAELEQVNMNLGKTDIQGEGICINLKENANDENQKKTRADDLLMIVNSLKVAGAEAISINNERIINMSDIVDINLNDDEWFIKVNGQRILAPYEIKAIGNQTYLESALLGNGGYVDELKKQERNVSIEKVNNIKITKYNDEIKSKYIE